MGRSNRREVIDVFVEQNLVIREPVEILSSTKSNANIEKFHSWYNSNHETIDLALRECARSYCKSMNDLDHRFKKGEIMAHNLWYYFQDDFEKVANSSYDLLWRGTVKVSLKTGTNIFQRRMDNKERYTKTQW